MENHKEKINFISFANVISAMAVIFLHSNSCFWIFSSTDRYWKTANFIESFFYFAVPVFFMITGATLIDFNKKYSLGVYLKKRFTKTVIPYLAWSIIGLLICTFFLHTIPIENITPKYVINGLFNGNIVSIYWFFIPLFCVYLSLPLFAAVSDEKKKSIFIYISIICFIINALAPFFLNTFAPDIGFSAVVRVGSGYLLFPVIGWLIYKYEMSPRVRVVIYILAIVGFLLQMYGTYTYSMKAGEVVKTFKGYENMPSILYGTGAFVFFKYAGSRIMKIRWVNATVIFLQKYTFPLYLMHYFILKTLLKELPFQETGLLYRLGAPFIVLGVTIGITFLIRKIPIIRNILP